MKTPIQIGKNIAATVEGSKLTLTIDLAKELGDSKSGKTVLVASTNGNQPVAGSDVIIGLNAYKRK